MRWEPLGQRRSAPCCSIDTMRAHLRLALRRLAIPLLATAGSTLATGCRNCHTYPCDRVSIAAQGASAGSRLAWRGNDLSIVPLADGVAPPDGSCWVTLDTVDDCSDQSPLSQEISASCSAPDGTLITLDLTLSDLRDIGPSTITVSVRAGVTAPKGASSYADGWGTLTIEVSTGRSAPFPTLVTPDYVKTFRLDYTLPGLNGANDVDATFRFTTTAGDFHGVSAPHTVCAG